MASSSGLGFRPLPEALEEAVAELAGRRRRPSRSPRLLTDWSAYLPDDYVPDEQRKLTLYRRLADARELAQLDEAHAEMRDPLRRAGRRRRWSGGAPPPAAARPPTPAWRGSACTRTWSSSCCAAARARTDSRSVERSAPAGTPTATNSGSACAARPHLFNRAARSVAGPAGCSRRNGLIFALLAPFEAHVLRCRALRHDAARRAGTSHGVLAELPDDRPCRQPGDSRRNDLLATAQVLARAADCRQTAPR